MSRAGDIEGQMLIKINIQIISWSVLISVQCSLEKRTTMTWSLHSVSIRQPFDYLVRDFQTFANICKYLTTS